VTITDPTTPVVESRWPRWALIVFPVLAIAVGGGLGYVVPVAEDAKVASQPAPHKVAKPTVSQPKVVEPPPAAVIEPPVVEPPAAEPPEIEVQPEPVKSAGGVVRVPPRPKHKPKPNKTTPCNVYEHMDGC
jgi:hypothetical protein